MFKVRMWFTPWTYMKAARRASWTCTPASGVAIVFHIVATQITNHAPQLFLTCRAEARRYASGADIVFHVATQITGHAPRLS